MQKEIAEMSTRRVLKDRHQIEAHAAQSEMTGHSESQEPRQMTLAEKVIMTINEFVGFGLLGADLWAANLGKAAK
jgi:hypothetical protein